MAFPKRISAFFVGLYHDEFKWSLVKSVGLFAFGIRLAREFNGMELVPASLLFGFVLASVAMGAAPNFILVLTDDQDLILDGLFVNSPICCPSRSTILTGFYAHNTGVTNNSINGNCSSRQWQKNYEPLSISAILKRRLNYRTFYAGKYLNQYGHPDVGGLTHVPEGYDWWLGLQGNSKYYNYTLSVNGTKREFLADEYLTDVIKGHVLEFLDLQTSRDGAFFVILAPPAAHAPFTPAPRHRESFPDVKAIRNAAFNFSSSDKHWIVEMPPKWLPEDITILDDMQRNRQRTLLAVDEMVAAIVEKLETINAINNTYVIFTSDNGFHIGQFTQPWDKRQPYNTDIRVPFMVRGPGIHRKVCSDFPISAVSIPATILDLAGIATNNTDGKSFKSELFKTNRSEVDNPERYVLIEYWGEANPGSVDLLCNLKGEGLSQCSLENWCKCQDSRNNTYACVVSLQSVATFKFCRFADGFVEAYDLIMDPHELQNVYKYMSEDKIDHFGAILEKLRSCKGSTCL